MRDCTKKERGLRFVGCKTTMFLSLKHTNIQNNEKEIKQEKYIRFENVTESKRETREKRCVEISRQPFLACGW